MNAIYQYIFINKTIKEIKWNIIKLYFYNICNLISSLPCILY